MPSNSLPLEKFPDPLELFRQWKDLAGPEMGRFVPATPFSGLKNFGFPPIQPLFYDEIGRTLAQKLAGSLEAEAVMAGEAAFCFDLPGPVSVSLGFYLGKLTGKISPVLSFGGLWRPGAVLEGKESATALAFYGQKGPPTGGSKTGYAFLLEQERFDPVSPLTLVSTFDNRYGAGIGLLPPGPFLLSRSIKAIIDVRVSGEPIPLDLKGYYRAISKEGLDVFQARLQPGQIYA